MEFVFVFAPAEHPRASPDAVLAGSVLCAAQQGFTSIVSLHSRATP